MAQYLSPGVYVEEVPSAVQPIAGHRHVSEHAQPGRQTRGDTEADQEPDQEPP